MGRLRFAFLFCAAACAGTTPSGEPERALPSRPSPTLNEPPPAEGAASVGCAVGESVCAAKDVRRVCAASPEGPRWEEETCPAGSGCYRGACTPGRCSDECTLGDTKAGATCAPFSLTEGRTDSKPLVSMHDRARGYLARMSKESMAAGGVGSAVYVDESLTTIETMDGIGDSALWTGTLLASEALRLSATGASDARARVRALVEVLHLWLNVAGEPGVLVRFAREANHPLPFSIGDLDCDTERVHCGIAHGGKTYDMIGHVSRDQYQGVMLGFGLAYEALTSADEDVRETIRRDVVTLVQELMKERTLPVKLTINGVPVPTSSVTAPFLVVSPREMDGGALVLRVNTGDFEASEMYGFQEFSPNLSSLLRQLPGLGWVPDVKRASSAIMLASFFRVALRVTEGVSAYAKDRSDILAYYTNHQGAGGNIGDWLAVAKGWTTDAKCGSSYYANNIAMMPMYNLARLEDDPSRAGIVKNDILAQKMWPVFATTKNSFFAFLYAGVAGVSAADAVVPALEQLAQFPAAPRVMRPTELRSDPRYASRQTGCQDQISHDEAVDVGDRVVADFLWQRHPWGLYDPGDPRRTQPGVDYLVAYFLALSYGFADDDRSGVCLAWQ